MGIGVFLAQHTQHPAQLGQRLPAGVTDQPERFGGLLGPRGRERGAAVGQANDHRDVMADDVVHLAGHPGSLVATARRAR